MNTGLSQRVAIVTGGARGLGAAIAEALQAEGARVAVLDVDVEGAMDRAQALDSSGATAIAIEADVGQREAFARAFDQVVTRFGRVDILVNNAARTLSSSFWDITDEEWDDVLRNNLRSVFVGCQLAGPHMRTHGFGRIINLSSLAGQQGGVVVGAHYAASKAGILALTKVVARELASSRVTVNAIAPAAVRTPVMDALPEERIASLEASIPVGRVGRPPEVAALAVFLASDAAAYITGATYDVNGGLLMR